MGVEVGLMNRVFSKCVCRNMGLHLISYIELYIAIQLPFLLLLVIIMTMVVVVKCGDGVS